MREAEWHIKAKRLMEEIQRSRTCLAEVLFQIDDLELRINPIIQSDYDWRVGRWLEEESKAELALRKAKRKYDIAKATLDAGNRPHGDSVSKLAEMEFEYQTKADEMAERAAGVKPEILRAPGAVSLSDNAKLLYRVIIEKIHPAFHGENAELDALYNLSRRAYLKGEEPLIESLYQMAIDSVPDVSFEGKGLDELYVDLEVCNAQVSFEWERLDKLKAEPPYTYKPLLDDPDWVRGQVDSIKKRIEACKAETDRMTSLFLEIAG